MDKNLRDSGIKAIGSVHWGTHIGYLYSAKADFYDALVPYIRAGLINNELCIWIYSQNTSYEEVKCIISESLKEVDSYIENGQLMIIPHTEWYIKDNSFNEIRVNRQWRELVENALSRGFEGLRAVADTSWLEKSYFRTFANYEHNVNDIISELPFIAICLYDANKVGTLEIAEVIKNHGYIITRHENKLEIIKNIELLIKDKQLEESQEKYKKLIQLLPDSVFIHDEEKIYYCNESALHMIGLKDKDELYKKSILELVPCDTKDRFCEYIIEALNDRKDIDYFQSDFLCSNNEIRKVEIVSTKYNSFGCGALLSVVRDITPFRKINKLEKDIERNRELLNKTLEYDKLKTEFFSNISHELKTPLSVILGTIQLIELQKQRSVNGIKEDKYLKSIKQNCFRLVRLVNNVIDLTKIDSNYYDIKKQNCDIVSLVRGITLSVAGYASSKKIAIVFDTNIEEKVIACDPDQIERIILNLLSNAIKFTQKDGSIMVTIHDRGEKIYITVKDNGVGIPPDRQKSIFNRFEQIDKSLTRQCEGSGIGLSLVKALVEKHSGRITVNSELGKGSEFVVEIPCIILKESERVSTFHPNTRIHDYAEKINIEFSDIYS